MLLRRCEKVHVMHGCYGADERDDGVGMAACFFCCSKHELLLRFRGGGKSILSLRVKKRLLRFLYGRLSRSVPDGGKPALDFPCSECADGACGRQPPRRFPA